MATTSQDPKRLQTVPNAGDVFGDETPLGLGNLGGSTDGPLEVVHVFWVAGMSCDGCSVAVTGATNPSVEELLAGTIPGLPRAVLHHPVLSVSAGAGFMKSFHAAARGELGAPYVLVIEGSIPDDQAFPSDSGYYSAMGAGGFDPISEGDQPNRMTDWVLKLAPGAAATVAIGTCATWGGIPAAAGNVTGSMSLTDFLGQDYRSALGVPIVNIPGCAPVGDNFTEVVAGLLMFLQGLGPLPEFDELGRPSWQFKETVHRHCVRAGYYEEGTFAEMPGDQECLVDVGCWGPVVQCNITERGAINHMGGCMVAGGACIGCTMPGFPDKFAPFYKAPPGSFVSGSISRTTGAGIRRLRRMSQANMNRTPLWDRTGHVPTPFAKQMSQPSRVSRIEGFFYKKLQYNGSADLDKVNKTQPNPKTMDFLGRGSHQELERYTPGAPGEGAHVEETT
ncbi:MAG: Ni,Fe-hydrogenase small subunit [Solirubrobacterales bacterium]|jgi:hydrogenase small subunit|nr:Ni,Fe-hydrogenase small subunit [Solirubrobacterales bacterium]